MVCNEWDLKFWNFKREKDEEWKNFSETTSDE